MSKISFTGSDLFEINHSLKLRREATILERLWYPRPSINQDIKSPNIIQRIAELRKHGYNTKDMIAWFRLDGKPHEELDRINIKNPRRKTDLKDSNKLFEDIKAYYNYRCAYCGKKSRKLTKDHIKPVSLRGLDDISNIVPACPRCNHSKWANQLENWKHFKKLQLHLLNQ